MALKSIEFDFKMPTHLTVFPVDGTVGLESLRMCIFGKHLEKVNWNGKGPESKEI